MSTELEVEALDLTHSCSECGRSFPTTRGWAVLRPRWCRLEQRPASRRSQLADKAVKLAKRKASVAFLPPVVMEGESLESVYQFDYLGCRFTSEVDDAADMRHRMATAGERSRSLDYLWRDNRLRRSLKLCLYAASVCSTLTLGSEAWMVTPRLQLSASAPHHREVVSRGGHQALVRHSDGCADAAASLDGPCPADACRPPSAPCGAGAGPTSWPAMPTWQSPDGHAHPLNELVLRAGEPRGWI